MNGSSSATTPYLTPRSGNAIAYWNQCRGNIFIRRCCHGAVCMSHIMRTMTCFLQNVTRVGFYVGEHLWLRADSNVNSSIMSHLQEWHRAVCLCHKVKLDQIAMALVSPSVFSFHSNHSSPIPTGYNGINVRLRFSSWISAVSAEGWCLAFWSHE